MGNMPQRHERSCSRYDRIQTFTASILFQQEHFWCVPSYGRTKPIAESHIGGTSDAQQKYELNTQELSRSGLGYRIQATSGVGA